MKGKIYTRAGDRGHTSLVGTRKVEKDDARVEAMGTLDELVSFLGMTGALLGESTGRRQKQRQEIRQALLLVEGQLLKVCGILAGSGAEIKPEEIAWLEEHIDRWQAVLEPVTSFILPGSGTVSACLHVCRTVCRRAERRMVAASRREEIEPGVLAYINRLSDFLFILARYAAHLYGEKEQET
jgi:cob(I)alamin adenosyltransferase